MYKFRSTTAGKVMWVGSTKVAFTAHNMGDSCGYYFTANEHIAEGIRKARGFGRFIIEETATKTPSADAEGTGAERTVYDDVTKTQEAIAILKEKHGVESNMRTRAEVLAEAAKVNVSFPKIEKK